MVDRRTPAEPAKTFEHLAVGGILFTTEEKLPMGRMVELSVKLAREIEWHLPIEICRSWTSDSLGGRQSSRRGGTL